MNHASHRNHGLDTLRALAIMLVFASHYMVFVSHEATFGWFSEIGWAGVDLFFALSGYLIGNQLFAAQRAGALAPGRFLARRLLRTLPAYFVVLAMYAFWPYWAGYSHPAPWWRYLSFTLNLGLQPGTLFSHAWSLCVEEQFYLLLPALVLLLATLRRPLRWGWLLLLCAVAGGMAWRAHWWQPAMAESGHGNTAYYTLIYYATAARFDELLAGVALAVLRNYHPAAWQRLTAHGNALLGAGLVMTGCSVWLLLEYRFGLALTVLGYPMLALAFATLILSALSPGSWLGRTRIPLMQPIALWSYSIYLLHKQLCMILGGELDKRFGLTPDDPRVIGLAVLASVLAGWLLYRTVERPFLRLRDAYVGVRSVIRTPTLPV